MKNYITKEDLPSILQDLAEAFLKHSNRIAVAFELVQLGGEDGAPTLNVKVQNNKGWEILATKEYEIIENPDDTLDVIDALIDTPIYRLNQIPDAK